MANALLILVIAASLSGTISSSEYNASRKHLSELPADIPTDTKILLLDYNKLADAPLARLGDFNLVALNLSVNGFIEFPDLAGIGSTLLLLSLRANKILSIPAEKIQDLAVLENLDLASNRFVAFPDFTPIGDTLLYLNLENNSLETLSASDVEPLTTLLNLTLDMNKDLVIGDITPLNHTLSSLRVSDAEISLQDLFRNFTNLTHLLADLGDETEFPDLSKSCGSLKTIQMGANSLGDIPSSYIDSCDVTEILRLDNNQLTAVPNITAMGRTLKNLLLSSNEISTMSQDFMRAQRALEIINLSENDLEEFPDISNSGSTLMLVMLSQNRIKTVPQAVSSSLTSLQILELHDNEIDEFPDLTMSNATLVDLKLYANHIAKIDASRLSPLKMLQSLQLHMNNLTSIPDVLMPGLQLLSLSYNRYTSMPSFTNLGLSLRALYLDSNDISFLRAEHFAGLENLLLLDLSSTKLTTLPELRRLDQLQFLYLSNTPIHTASPSATFSLGRLFEVHLQNTDLETIPTMCPESSLTLHLENNSNLDLCSSRMAWVKQSFFAVHYTDMMCHSIGKYWSQATFEELLAIPSVPKLGDVKQLYIGLNITDTLCRWPTSGILPSMTWHECLFSCLHAEGCGSFNYHQQQEWCALVVPTPGQERQILEDDVGWDLYV